MAIFVAIAIFIACLGLFGLAAFTSGRRTKEIGIRKVFGAPHPWMWVFLLRGSSPPAPVANLIAWPLPGTTCTTGSTALRIASPSAQLRFPWGRCRGACDCLDYRAGASCAGRPRTTSPRTSL